MFLYVFQINLCVLIHCDSKMLEHQKIIKFKTPKSEENFFKIKLISKPDNNPEYFKYSQQFYTN